MEASLAEERETRRDLGVLRRLSRYLAPYRLSVLGALVALAAAAGTVLAMGQGLRFLVDKGLASGNAALLDDALLVLLAVILLRSEERRGGEECVSPCKSRGSPDK